MASAPIWDFVMDENECPHHINPISSRLRKLTEANRSLAEIESLDDLFPRLMDLAKEVMAAEASVLFLYNQRTACWRPHRLKMICLGTKMEIPELR